MCGGVGFKTKNIPDEELSKFYSPELVRRFKTSGRIESFFWYKDPVLPVKTKKGVQLLLWGNKDETVKLPKTGWAKEESLKEGKWNYLRPEPVDIPVDSGYEKKTWFDMPRGTKGIVVRARRRAGRTAESPAARERRGDSAAAVRTSESLPAQAGLRGDSDGTIEERVYMITKEANEEYKKETGHGREPLGEKKNYEHELGSQNKLI